MKLTADALNHLLRQNSWAAEKLRPFAGKVVRLALPPLQNTLCIDGIGEFAPAPPDAAVDAEIILTPGAALRLLFQPEAAASLVSLQGDPQLASTVGKVLQGLRWDAEEDLSRIVGDIPAHEMGQAGMHVRRELQRQAQSLAGMFAEYWLEEQPLIAKKRHLENFSRDVDTLRDDIERLTKRLQKLEENP